MIPVMALVLRFPFHKIAGTSSSVIIFISLAGAIGYMIQGYDIVGLPAGSLGFVHFPVALIIMVSAITFAPVGAYLNQKTRSPVLKIAFSVFLVIMGIKLLLFP